LSSNGRKLRHYSDKKPSSSPDISLKGRKSGEREGERRRAMEKKNIHSAEAPTFPQPHPGPLSEFERTIIQECRENGMTDEEIAAWLREI